MQLCVFTTSIHNNGDNGRRGGRGEINQKGPKEESPSDLNTNRSSMSGTGTMKKKRKGGNYSLNYSSHRNIRTGKEDAL